MFSWNFAKSAEAVFSRLAVKKICKFLLKKKLGQFILGDIDLDHLDVQLTNGTIQLSDLAINVDFINHKFGGSSILVVKEGSIGALTVKLPWKNRNCEIELDELEIVVGPGQKRDSHIVNEAFTSGQDEFVTPGHEAVNSSMATSTVDLHEGVKTIAKMVKWLLTSFHVKVRKLIVALDLPEEPDGKRCSTTLVLRFGEVECGTGISDDVDSKSQQTVDGFLGLSRLTNFVKFDAGTLEFIRPDGNATTPVITGQKGGVSGTIKLSIPWKNGSLDIRKLDADVNIDPLELRLQPSSMKSVMHFMNVFEELDKDRKSFMHNKPTESIYHSVSSSHGSFEFSSQKPDSYSPIEKDSVFNALLRSSHLISDWMTSSAIPDQEQKNEESEFGASVDQFFECFDELRSSQSALGNSGMWNWTCSVFSAITAASNLASGSLYIEQKHVETSLKARITQIMIMFSFVDDDEKKDVHYINADINDMQLVLQVCPQESNFEATVYNLEVSDCFGNHSLQFQLIKNKQDEVERACPPLGFLNNHTVYSSAHPREGRGIYRSDVAKVLLLKFSSVTRFRYISPSVSQDIKPGPKSFSLNLPPLIFWVNFQLISTALDFFKEIENSVKRYGKKDLSISPDDSLKGSPKETIRGNISLMDARLVLCFPCEKIECYGSYKNYLSWNKFIVIDLSSPAGIKDRKTRSRDRFRVTVSSSLHINVGNVSVYFVSSNTKLKFQAERVLTVFDKTGHPSVISMIWQDNAVTGPWITKRAKVVASSGGTTSRNNRSKGKSHGFAFVTTTKDMEDVNYQTREELVSSSSFILHVNLAPVTINLDRSLYQTLHDHLHQVTIWLSCISPDPVVTTENQLSQSSVIVECDLLEISVSVSPVENIKASIQSELPGSWCNLRLKVVKFDLLTVSNTGGISGANFLWVAHGEGDLWGSTTGVPGKQFLLISCDKSNRGRGNGDGSNILSSRFPGSDIIHMWDPDTLASQISVNIKCATIVAVGCRLDWFGTIISFFSLEGDGSKNEESRSSGSSSFVLNLIDIGLSYEPYSSHNNSFQELCVGALLAASSLKLLNVFETDYEIKAHDLGLLLCEESGVKNLNGSYNEQTLRNNGYVKVVEGSHLEAVLRTDCKNRCEWELKCSDSHIVLETCQDSTFGFGRLAAQIQQIFAPDVEESMVHLQTRWDNYKLALSKHSTSSSSDTNQEVFTVNLMDEICEETFNLSHKSSAKVSVPVSGPGNIETLSSHAIFPELIDGYFLSDSCPSQSAKSATVKDPEAQTGSGWYGDSLLNIVEDHVLGICEKTSSKLVGTQDSVSQTGNVKVKGLVVLKNIDVRWTLYAGSDWEYTRNKAVCLEFALSKLGLRCNIFPDGEICVSKMSLSVQDFSLNDVSKGAPWVQVLGCYQSKDRPRESRSRALKLDLESVRPHPSTPLEEYRLQIAVLPMRLHLHQSHLEFLISFFGGKNLSDHPQDIPETDISAEALLPFFQKFSISPVVIRVDYIPSHVDLVALGHGKFVELVNVFQWKGVELKLKHVESVGVYGWSSVCETIIGEWLEDISQNQIHKLLKGLPPIRSLVAVGSSAAKLVSLPVKNYKKDRRIVKGIQRGTIAFLRSVSLEAIGLGAHLAAGAHAILVQAEDIVSTSPPSSPIHMRVNPNNARSSQPKDARQGIQQALETMGDGLGKSAAALVQAPLKKYQRGAGVGSALCTAIQAAPGAAIAPASAAARAVHSALLGARNSLDPEHKKDSIDKYLGTTQAERR
ncbi:autophagy-related protein 2-like [Bidens hawaiensis]|uniref:autophagy-related protein 2-like n=1 Tax=Bidens hawaiensis TaxID=980011 RepID=UPI00404A1C89